MRAAFFCTRKLPVPLHALLRRSAPTWTASIRHTTRHSGNLRCHSSQAFQRHASLRGTFYSNAQLRALCLGTLTTAALALTVTQQGAEAEAEAPPGAADKTTEELMLAESERERRARSVPDEDCSLVRQLFRTTQLFVIDYIIEPLATGFRFVTLVAIFAPVILTVPLIYVGERVSSKSDERTGTLWWYGFLVASLERAGPTFIKVESLSGGSIEKCKD
jgi:aarF domain-containing kinase